MSMAGLGWTFDWPDTLHSARPTSSIQSQNNFLWLALVYLFLVLAGIL